MHVQSCCLAYCIFDALFAVASVGILNSQLFDIALFRVP